MFVCFYGVDFLVGCVGIWGGGYQLRCMAFIEDGEVAGLVARGERLRVAGNFCIFKAHN